MQHISKSEFARRVERTPAAVTHWINDGILTPPALVDVDGAEMINEFLARQQLRDRLDPRQQVNRAAPIGDDDDVDDEDRLPSGIDPSSKKRILDARAEKEELLVEEQRRKLALANGKYLETEAAKRAWGKQFAEELSQIDMWIGEAAKELASEMQIDERLALICVRKSWRAFRERRAAAARNQLAQAAE